MHVAVEDALAGGLVHVDADVVAVGMESLVNLLLHVLQHDVHGLALVVRQVEVVGHVALGDDERMAGRDGIAVVESDAGGRLADDFNTTRQPAERAGLALLAGQFVEMVVLIQLVALVGDEALVGQSDVALIRPLLVYGMKPEALFRQVAAHGKVGRPFWRQQVGNTHQYLSLSVWLKHVKHIVTDDGVEFALGKIWTIIIVVANYIMTLLLQFVSIETISAAEIKNLTLQQVVLKQVSCRHGDVSAYDSREVRVIDFLWLHSIQYFHVSKPILRAI